MNRLSKLIIIFVLLFGLGDYTSPVFINTTHAANKTLTLTAPNGGESYKVGDVVPVRWTSTGNVQRVTLTLIGSKQILPPTATDEQKLENVTFIINIVPDYIKNTGSYDWLIDERNDPPSTNYYQLQVFAEGGADSWDFDTSDGYLTINKSTTGPKPTHGYPVPHSGPAGTIVTLTGTGFLASNTIQYRNDNYGTGTITNVPSTDAQTVQFQLPPFLPAGTYHIRLGNANGISDVSYGFNVTASNNSVAHAVGTNVLGSDGTVYFISSGSTRSPYTSAGAFLSYKFNTWAGVVTANSADMALPLTTYTPNSSTQTTTYYIPPRNGSLINDKGTVYLITNGLRAGFTSEKIFRELGYSFGNVYPGDTSFMVTLAPINSSAIAHPDGTLINDNGTVYVMKNGNRMGFPTMAVFDSWGYWMSEAAPANNYDKQAPISGVIQTKMANQLSI